MTNFITFPCTNQKILYTYMCRWVIFIDREKIYITLVGKISVPSYVRILYNKFLATFIFEQFQTCFIKCLYN